MDKIEKIRQEIERQIEEEKNNLTEETELYYGARQQVRSKLLSFLDTLSEELDKSLEEAEFEYAQSLNEMPANQEEEKMIYDAFIAGAEWQKEQHKSVPGKYTEMDFESARNTFSEDVYNHNRKNKTPIDMVNLDDAFETGADWMEKQMLKDAVEASVNTYELTPGGSAYVEFVADMPVAHFRSNDKVRIIVLKGEE